MVSIGVWLSNCAALLLQMKNTDTLNYKKSSYSIECESNMNFMLQIKERGHNIIYAWHANIGVKYMKLVKNN